MTGALVLGVCLGGCSREQAPSPDAGGGRVEAHAPSSSPSASPAPPRRLVDPIAAPKCTLTYHCGLSHPGLGSRSNTLTIDLAACSKAVTSSSRAWEAPPAPPGPPPPKTKLAPATCSDLARRVGAITDRDASEAQESARMDSTACRLTAECPDQLVSVQRQSLSGPSPVVQLIQAMHSAR